MRERVKEIEKRDIDSGGSDKFGVESVEWLVDWWLLGWFVG